MRGKMVRRILKRRISQIVMVVLTLFLTVNFTYADAQTGPDIRLVLQVTIDGLRADLINRWRYSLCSVQFDLDPFSRQSFCSF